MLVTRKYLTLEFWKKEKSLHNRWSKKCLVFYGSNSGNVR